MHLFGLGAGWLPDRVAKIAAEHGATLVNYTDAPCTCGHGCNPHTCPRSRRHWFECRDLGQPHNGETARDVMAAIQQR